ncbi:DNA-directed RNA polymerase sigma-70 factor [Pseudonocardia sulfidoxydans NBRC 16205]|uniref:DNA-directed RNA polymerase sigma-70 factor n=1 Tax=Pseudonocardia sulfidoxydans NBRC 16205 TaxID=1223511 RepID=A0A511DD10_9PSEU|nr:sigma-70 family RNA polymerase sigma factor [Pseudonocardia sulfidoxydans]GEL22679.1 DNA-directed RNA polymerase sigma-70 factor [Pseudonocardia sulfidoxydans NBRC 16205]
MTALHDAGELHPAPGAARRNPTRAAPQPDSAAEPARPVVATPDDLDEQTLVVRAQEGDVRAFETLARRHQVALYRLAVRVLGNRADAEDALQDGLLDAWRRIGSFRGEASFSTWLYRIVTNRCLGLLRRTRPAVPVADPTEAGDVVGARSASPERQAELDAGMTALAAALTGLPHDQRVCFVLRELEGLGYAEIAEITGARETTVRGRIHRARKALAEVMRPWR